MLAHFRAHLALGHSVWTGKVQLESVDACVLDHARQFLPAVLVKLFHDRSNENMLWILFFDLTKLIQPDIDRAIRNELNVFKTDDLARRFRTQFAITRYHIYNLGRFQANRLRDSAAPPGVIRLGDHARVRARRAGAQQKRVREGHSVDYYR